MRECGEERDGIDRETFNPSTWYRGERKGERERERPEKRHSEWTRRKRTRLFSLSLSLLHSLFDLSELFLTLSSIEHAHSPTV